MESMTNCFLSVKEAVVVISSHLKFKEGHAKFTTVPLKKLYLNKKISLVF